MGEKPVETAPECGFERVKSTYTAREISRKFGLGERSIRGWTRQGVIRAVATEDGNLCYDFRALAQFRKIQALQQRGLTRRQIIAELSQLSLLAQQGEVIRLPTKLSPFEQGLRYHDQDGAAESYREAIRDGECVPDAYCNLALLELDAGRLVKAIDCLTRALVHDPRHFESHYNLANLYLDVGQARLACLHYQIAAEIEPDFPSVHYNLALAHALMGEVNAAVAALGRYKSLAPKAEASRADKLAAKIKLSSHAKQEDTAMR